MEGRIFLRALFFCFFAGFLAASGVQAQSAKMSGALVLRLQAGSVAEEALAKLGTSLKGVDQLVLYVEGGNTRTLIENAFLELLSRQGIRASLHLDQAGSNRILHIVAIEQAVRYDALSSGEYRREVRTTIETRDILRDSSVTRYGGLCSRSEIDTVAFREDVGLLPVGRDSERTLFDKLLGPVLLIGGAFLVVYLFFTVRN